MRERIAPPIILALSTHALANSPATRLSQSRASYCSGGAHAAAADATGGPVHDEVRQDVRENHGSSSVSESAGRLPFVALLFWALLAFLVPGFVQALNLVDVFAFPLGFFMTAQGALLAFVVIGVLSARWQDRRTARRATDH